jgi:Uma2 family endonuclease
MLKYVEPLDWLPTAEELPDSDDTPVDNELQESAPTLLKLVLAELWEDRMDWFFGIDMGIYYNPDEPPIVPDAFLSIGVDSVKSENLRPSYVLWEEKGILPQLVLEVVSPKYRGEYSTKKDFYERLGILYYAIYNPKRKRKPTLEVYKLIQGKYLPVVGNPIWLPEIGLGIGKERATFQLREREWMFWYDEAGERYLTPQEMNKLSQQRAQQAEQQAKQAERQAKQAERQAKQAERQAKQAEQKAQRLADRLRELGIDPDSV